MYVVQEDAGACSNFVKSFIACNDFVTAGFVGYDEDYLTGYNFYLQTSKKLHILSCSSAAKAVTWVKCLR